MHSNRSQQPPNMHYSDPFAAPRQWEGRLNVNVDDCSLRARRWKSSGWFHREVIISLALFFREPCSDIQLEGVPTADDTVLMSLALALKGQLTQLKETLCIGAFSSTQPFWSFTDKRNSTQLCFKDSKTSNCTVLVKIKMEKITVVGEISLSEWPPTVVQLVQCMLFLMSVPVFQASSRWDQMTQLSEPTHWNSFNQMNTSVHHYEFILPAAYARAAFIQHPSTEDDPFKLS